ncbi:hypothetical protein HAX54_000435 [Datura stramonium]|uniref:Uncharacterized protein n=1 Tax=Datura stramonium TaxID=4076 RepID=A0ABS8T117_DATST|nr:hypothetical protein [Datura stramonium]
MDRELSQFLKAEMEAILGPDSEPFETFISHLKAEQPDAEAMLNLIKQRDTNSLALKLADLLGSSHNIDLREKCADLLCQLLLDDISIRLSLRVSTQSNIKNLLKESTSLLYQMSHFQFKQATIAATSFIQCLSSSNEKERFQDLLPGMMRSLTDASCNNEGYSTQGAVELFIDFAKKEPRFLRR